MTAPGTTVPAARLAPLAIAALALLGFGAMVLAPATDGDGAAAAVSLAEAQRSWMDAHAPAPTACNELRRQSTVELDEAPAPPF